MNTRSVVASPPAVAGLVLLVLVIGAVIGIRSGMSTGGDTDVAGVVVERSEPLLATEAPTAAEPINPVVVRPRPDVEEPQADEPAPAAAPVAPAPVAQAPAPSGDVGLVRAPAPAPAPHTGGRDSGDTTSPRAPREQEPAPEPKPEPKPEPEPDPSLREGTGHSVHTAESWTDRWEFKQVEGHEGNRSPSSRQAAARLTVQLTQSSLRSDATRFQCAAWLDAGSRRLTTDTNHFFTVSLVQLDANMQPTGNEGSGNTVFHREAYDLAPGQHTRGSRMLTNPVDVDPADGYSYTCHVTYSS